MSPWGDFLPGTSSWQGRAKQFETPNKNKIWHLVQCPILPFSPSSYPFISLKVNKRWKGQRKVNLVFHMLESDQKSLGSGLATWAWCGVPHQPQRHPNVSPDPHGQSIQKPPTKQWRLHPERAFGPFKDPEAGLPAYYLEVDKASLGVSEGWTSPWQVQTLTRDLAWQMLVSSQTSHPPGPPRAAGLHPMAGETQHLKLNQPTAESHHTAWDNRSHFMSTALAPFHS